MENDLKQEIAEGDSRPLSGEVADFSSDLHVESAQELQHEAWKKLRANSQPWLITDLVTLGSPLSAAHFLMAPSAERLAVARDCVGR